MEYEYRRESRAFSPITIEWMNTPAPAAMREAGQRVVQEVADLDRDLEADLRMWRQLG